MLTRLAGLSSCRLKRHYFTDIFSKIITFLNAQTEAYLLKMRGSLGFLFFQPNGQLNENINCLRFE